MDIPDEDEHGNGNNSPEDEVPITTDPREFFEQFHVSNDFQQGFERFFEGKTPAAGVTQEQKEISFMRSDIAKVALLDFYQHGLHYQYDPAMYPPEVAQTMSAYIESVRDMAKMLRSGADAHQIQTLDIMRTTAHEAIASALVKAGIAPSEKLGRQLARIVLIEKKLDTVEGTGARQRDIDRIKRMFGH